MMSFFFFREISQKNLGIIIEKNYQNKEKKKGFLNLLHFLSCLISRFSFKKKADCGYELSHPLSAIFIRTNEHGTTTVKDEMT